ncbi:MAG: DUF4268 domain-containing protein [SAR324 cluster bacterium]|nr:DUF4268 domain-containing protein [SAR324 cluster bacterium]
MSCTSPQLLKPPIREAPREVLPVFWRQLLLKANEKGILTHEACHPVRDTRLCAKTGQHGVHFDYVISLELASIELWIDTGVQIVNKRIFDQLHKKRKIVETRFNGELSWERLGTRRFSRIRTFAGHGGIKHGEAHWNILQDEMIGLMDRFYKALKPALAQQI